MEKSPITENIVIWFFTLIECTVQPVSIGQMFHAGLIFHLHGSKMLQAFHSVYQEFYMFHRII